MSLLFKLNALSPVSALNMLTVWRFEISELQKTNKATFSHCALLYRNGYLGKFNFCKNQRLSTMAGRGKIEILHLRKFISIMLNACRVGAG